MALFSSAADTFVFSFPIRRLLFREGHSTTEMLPAQEAWRISGEGLFTGVRGRGILRSSGGYSPLLSHSSLAAIRRLQRRGRRRRATPELPVEDDQPDRHGQPHAHVD